MKNCCWSIFATIRQIRTFAYYESWISRISHLKKTFFIFHTLRTKDTCYFSKFEIFEQIMASTLEDKMAHHNQVTRLPSTGNAWHLLFGFSLWFCRSLLACQVPNLKGFLVLNWHNIFFFRKIYVSTYTLTTFQNSKIISEGVFNTFMKANIIGIWRQMHQVSHVKRVRFSILPRGFTSLCHSKTNPRKT